MRGEVRPPNTRDLSLDVLRTVAVFLTLGRHMWAAPRNWPQLPVLLLDSWRQGGWVGVDLFFVLSGFLVSRLLFVEYARHKRINVGHFYLRRGLKIYPSFYFFLALSSVMLYAYGDPPTAAKLLPEIFFFQSYWEGLWGHTWSLAVEEHFYLLLPLVLLFLARFSGPERPFRHVPTLAGAIMVLLLGWRMENAWRHPFERMTHMFPTHLRIDSLFLGVLAGYVWITYPGETRRLLLPWRWMLIMVGGGLLVPPFILPLEHWFIYTGGFSLFACGSCALMMGLLLCSIPSNPLTRFVGFLGTRSYSIYLWHFPMYLFGADLVEFFVGGALPFGYRLVVYFAGSVIVGVAMATLVELPVLHWRDRQFPGLPMRQAPR